MLGSLRRRTRTRHAVRRALSETWLRDFALLRDGEELRRRDAHTAGEALLGLAAGRRAGPGPDSLGSVGAALVERARPELPRLERELEVRSFGDEDQRHLASASSGQRDVLLLLAAVAAGDAAVVARTRLAPHEPPPTVHAMDRGGLAAAGAIDIADLVADAFDGSGAALAADMRVLDFGCSSGRVVRALAAVHDEVEWLGCDPNATAVAWAARHVPGRYFVSDDVPPLEIDERSLDAVFAISVWSHFSSRAARSWLEEMHRVVRPGGRLLLTAHGWRSLALHHEAHDRGAGGLTPLQVLEVQRALAAGETWSFDPFGEEGDWGVVHDDWGHSYLSPEWILAQTRGRWSCVWFAASGLRGDQDVYVLERR